MQRGIMRQKPNDSREFRIYGYKFKIDKFFRDYFTVKKLRTIAYFGFLIDNEASLIKGVHYAIQIFSRKF